MVLESRIMVLLYAALFASAVYFDFLWVLAVAWIAPRVAGEPIQRIIRVAEHVGCDESPDLLRNTRTTLTNRFVNAIAWQMPYHAEHHLFPNVPFHALPAVHALVGGSGGGGAARLRGRSAADHPDAARFRPGLPVRRQGGVAAALDPHVSPIPGASRTGTVFTVRGSRRHVFAGWSRPPGRRRPGGPPSANALPIWFGDSTALQHLAILGRVHAFSADPELRGNR